MITIETYIKNKDFFVKVNSNTKLELITDPFYIEGAILIRNYSEEIMGFKQWDLIDHLWSYMIDAIDELICGKQEISFMFPDQPLKMTLSTERKNKNRLLITIGENKYTVEKAEFILELLFAASKFYEYLEQCDASVMNRKNKIQEIMGKQHLWG